MDIWGIVADRRTADSFKIAALQTRRAELWRGLRWQQEKELPASANDANVVTQVRAKIAQAEAEIADIEKQIATIREWKVPERERLLAVQQLEFAHYSAASAVGFHEGDAIRAEYQERPKAAAEARKQQAEAQAEWEKTRIKLRKAIENLGLDPTPMCGTA
jgi:hypothetical protein